MNQPQPYLLPVWDTISLAWEKVRGTKGSVWGALILIVAITLAFSLLYYFAAASSSLRFIIQLIAFIVVSLLEIGLLYIGILRAFDLPFSFASIFRIFQSDISIKVIGTYLLESIIYMIIGAILFCIFGILYLISGLIFDFTSILFLVMSAAFGTVSTIIAIFISFRFILSFAYVLDKKMNPWLAIKNSFATTHSNVWRIIAVFCIQTIILLISIIPLGIGLIWSIPFSLILYGLVYKNLTTNQTNTTS